MIVAGLSNRHELRAVARYDQGQTAFGGPRPDVFERCAADIRVVAPGQGEHQPYRGARRLAAPPCRGPAVRQGRSQRHVYDLFALRVASHRGDGLTPAP